MTGHVPILADARATVLAGTRDEPHPRGSESSADRAGSAGMRGDGDLERGPRNQFLAPELVLAEMVQVASCTGGGR